MLRGKRKPVLKEKQIIFSFLAQVLSLEKKESVGVNLVKSRGLLIAICYWNDYDSVQDLDGLPMCAYYQTSNHQKRL